MKANLYDISGKKVKEIELPEQFNEEYRQDIIKRASEAIRANNRQAYGANHRAGMRQRGKLSRRRRKYKGAYGKGISHVPRKTLTKRGTQFYWVGAEVPSTVGGRRAHPPKAEKIWDLKINHTERKKAIRSALNATTQLNLVNARGHKTNNTPYIIEAKLESIQKAKDLQKLLETIGLKEELERVNIRKVRAGKGKMRGRPYKTKTGPLLILSENCELIKGASNIPGVETINVKELNAEILAPGNDAGRLCVWSEKALEQLKKENLFMKKTRTLKENKE